MPRSTRNMEGDLARIARHERESRELSQLDRAILAFARAPRWAQDPHGDPIMSKLRRGELLNGVERQIVMAVMTPVSPAVSRSPTRRGTPKRGRELLHRTSAT